MTGYPLFNQTALFAGDQQPVDEPMTVALIAAPNNLLARGTLLGQVTASGALIPCVQTAADGSQKPYRVLAADIDASIGPQVVPVYKNGEFAWERMTVDPSWTSPQMLQAAFDAAGLEFRIRQLGILG